MASVVACPQCGATLDASRAPAGARVRCVRGGAVFQIPAPPAAITAPVGEPAPVASSPAPASPAPSYAAAAGGLRPKPPTAASRPDAPGTRAPSTRAVDVADLAQVVQSRAGAEPPPCVGDPADLDLAAHVWLQPGEQVIAKYYARKRVPEFRFMALLLTLITCVGWIPYLLWLVLGSRSHGVIVVTNRRLIYVEFTKGLLGRGWHACSLDLDSIAGVQCYSQHGIRKFLGLFITKEKRAFLLEVRSRYPVRFAIGGITTLASQLFVPADDAVTMAQQIGSLIIEVQNRLQVNR